MSDLNQLNGEIEQMRHEVKGTVDINYERYNTVFMGKVEKFNRLKKQGIQGKSGAELQENIEKSVRDFQR
jgi:hypothetical protein